MIRCVGCEFYEQGEDYRSGHCHRYAPRPELFKPHLGMGADLFWPPVRHDDGCGEGQIRGED